VSVIAKFEGGQISKIAGREASWTAARPRDRFRTRFARVQISKIAGARSVMDRGAPAVTAS
jgi:hypothetical protein